MNIFNPQGEALKKEQEVLKELESMTYELKHTDEELVAWLETSDLKNDTTLADEEKFVQADLELRRNEKLSRMQEFLHHHNMLINYKKHL